MSASLEIKNETGERVGAGMHLFCQLSPLISLSNKSSDVSCVHLVSKDTADTVQNTVVCL